MSNFILIHKECLRFATSDLLLNLENIVSVMTREERDYPLIEVSAGNKDLLQIKFNENDIRDQFFKFMISQCKPKEIGELVPAVSMTEKKRRASRD